MYGYGMSLFAWARADKHPRWMGRLRLDARENMSRGLRYLWKTGDSVFQPNYKAPASVGDDRETTVGRLTHSSASFRLLGLYELLDQGAVPTDAIDKVALLMDDRDSDISSTAAHLVGIIGEPAISHAPRLLDMLGSQAPANREQAGFALGELRPQEPLVLRELSRLLDDERTEVCQAAAEALGKFGPAAQGAAKQLLRRYEQSLIKGEACIDSLAAALTRVFPDAQARVRDHFSDAELCRFAERCLAELQSHESAAEA